MASILLALAADAWIERRSDRIHERAELEGLREQLIETRALLVRSIELDEANEDQTAALIRVVESGLTPGRVEVADSLLRSQLFTTFFEPPLARFESIIASGRLELIQDDELRAEVANWPREALLPQFSATSRREMFRNQFIPSLYVDHDLDDWSTSRPIGELTEIPVSNELVNILKARQWLNGVVLRSERRTLTRLDSLLERIDEWVEDSA